VEDLDEVQGLAVAAFLHHDARRGVFPHRADEAGRERQALLAPGQQMHHGGGVPMLRGVGEPLQRRQAPGLACLAGGRAGGTSDALAIAAPTRVAAASRGVPVRPATEVAPAGAATLAAARATAPPGAMAMVVERPTPEGSAAAAAASASKVFLLQLPGGRPRLRGTGGVAAGSFALFWLPSERSRLRPPDPPGAPAPAPLTAPNDDIGGGGAEGEKRRRLLGEEKERGRSRVGKTLEGSET
jgi:hypothetical protein